MSITDTDLQAEALARLVEQFKKLTNFASLLGVYSQQSQDAQEALLAILNDTNIDDSEGAQLDGIGRIVGEERFGRDDAPYRTALRLRIMVNLSRGTTEDIISILFLLTELQVTVQEIGAASILVTLSGAVNDTDASIAANYLANSRSAGVGSQLIYSDADDSETFFFSTGDTEEASVDQGWADDAQTTGGVFADVLEA